MPDVTFSYAVYETQPGSHLWLRNVADVPVSITFGDVTKSGTTNSDGRVHVGPFDLAASTNGTITVNHPPGKASLHLAGFTSTVYVVIAGNVLQRVSPHIHYIGLGAIRATVRLLIFVNSNQNARLPGAVVTVSYRNFRGVATSNSATTNTEGEAEFTLEMTRAAHNPLSVRVSFGGEDQVLMENINYEVIFVSAISWIGSRLGVTLPGVSHQGA